MKYTAKYKSHTGKQYTKQFNIKDYSSALDCLLYIENKKEQKELIELLSCILTLPEITQLKSLITPSNKQIELARKNTTHRKALTKSSAYQKSLQKEINRMVSHPGFMGKDNVSATRIVEKEVQLLYTT
jgi:hypothetical protein